MTPITLPHQLSRTSQARAPRTSQVTHAPHTFRVTGAPRTARPLPRAFRAGACDPHDETPPDAVIGVHGAIGRYTDSAGRTREVVARPGPAGTVLVIDWYATTLGDRRLVAHLAADEPAENAGLICRHYLADSRRPRCRPVTPADLHGAPSAEGCGRRAPEHTLAPSAVSGELRDREGLPHRLEPLDVGMSIPELRWRRHPADGEDGAPRTESVRDAVGCFESYEPIRILTAAALVRHREDATISVAVLGAELRRMEESRIVLNRALRRAVLSAIRTQGLSLSEIALRCGRIKRDAKGNTSGETSWLARRVGIAPESGGGIPTPWIHTEVLALIARNGLGICPREVEL
ncbi:MAG TPA: hypothetical protein VNY52_13020 [Solirubrobacteraceae bacterium]|jgi:hypothetical protein|nr:hypothetical protein [Solirubrobacteraceae bacterium]